VDHQKKDRQSGSTKVPRLILKTVLGYRLVNLSLSVVGECRKECLMITRQFTRDELQQAFNLAFVLHPSAEVALRVLARACDLLDVLEQNEARRDRSEEHYKSRIPPEALLQFAVYCASWEWELDQESPLPKKKPRYNPTRDDLVVRYLKHLVWNTSLKANFSALGIGLGCLLYDYRPKQMSDLLGLSDELSIRRIKRGINKQLMLRFKYAEVLTSKGNAIRTTPASDRDRELILQALKAFTPWNTTHIPPDAEESLLEKLVDDESTLTDWDRKHALLDPECGGLASLIIQHNKLYARFREGLDHPNLRLCVPDFESTPTPPVDRFQAPRLTDSEIFFLNDRLKSRGSRVCDIKGLLYELHECEVDQSIIRLFDDWASSTNESPPLQAWSQGSYAIRRKWASIVEERGDEMGFRVVIIGMGGTGADVLSCISALQEMPMMKLGFPIEPDLDLNRGHYRNVLRCCLEERITYEPLRRLRLVWNIAEPIVDDNHHVTKFGITDWDFTKRSISEDLSDPWTSLYDVTKDRDWCHTIGNMPRHVLDFRWNWLDDPKPKLNISGSLRISWVDNYRERGNDYELCGVYDSFVNIRRTQTRTPTPLRRANLLEMNAYQAMIDFHLVEQEPLHLKPFVPKKESIMSDWYDRASARKVIARLRHSPPIENETDALDRWVSARSDSLLRLWALSSPANPANHETDAR